MVDPSMPWSLKGISDEAREYAKSASAAADIPVGSWLSAVIHAAALQDGLVRRDGSAGAVSEIPPADPPRTTAEKPPAPRAAGLFAGDRSSNTIERAVEFVSSYGVEPEGPVRDEDLIEDPDFLQAELDALEARLSASDAATDAAIEPLIREIERLRGRLESIRSR